MRAASLWLLTLLLVVACSSDKSGPDRNNAGNDSGGSQQSGGAANAGGGGGGGAQSGGAGNDGNGAGNGGGSQQSGGAANAGGGGGGGAQSGGAANGGADAFVDQIRLTGIDKIDLLFMVDNSVSMADKQEILKEAVPDLVGRLVSPACVDENGAQAPNQPVNPEDDCPTGYGRAFQPILNINIGIITSSLGGFGATKSACTSTQSLDMAHLLGSLDRGSVALTGSAYADSLGFLKWREGGTRQAFQTDFQNLIAVSGENGCGFEASLEAWYRFLVDPEPYGQLTRVSCSGGTDTNCVAPTGIDQAVLDQRAAFLRPDSLVAVILLTDENDCSIRVGGRYWFVADIGNNTRMYRSSTTCETDPNDKCCYSCGVSLPSGCTADPNCGDPTNPNEAGDLLTSAEDASNLRCFHQKQRFGLDFLYPTTRYSNALFQRELCLDRTDLSTDAQCSADRTKPNPLYETAEGKALPRDPSYVFLAGIVGVPWQDVAVNPADTNTLTYKTFAALTTDKVWDTILGDGLNPGDPLMKESIAPRVGINPVTQDPLAPVTANSPLANPINGHEWDVSQLDDLQYACIFPLQSTKDCSLVPDTEGCDCQGEGAAQDSRPLCQADDGTYSPLQRFAKAYPGIRHLQVLKDYGALTGNAIVASICARNVTDNTKQDYGYRPTIDAIVDRLQAQLTDRCSPRSLTPNDQGNVPCSIVEATLPAGGSCSCAAGARNDLLPELAPTVRQRLEQSSLCTNDPNAAGTQCSAFCLCEVTQLSGAAATDCQTNETPASTTNGWCYVDPEQGIGDPALVVQCPITEKRKLRFVGEGNLATGSTNFLVCSGANLNAGPVNDGGPLP